MENSALLIMALKKIGVYNIPVELLKYNLENSETVNEIIAVILEEKVKTYEELISFLDKNHDTNNNSEDNNSENAQGNSKSLNSSLQGLSNQLSLYFENLVQDSSDKLSKVNKVFERKKTREEISKKVNEHINEIFSNIKSDPKDEKNINSVFKNISEGINNTFTTVSQEFSNAVNQAGEEKSTSFDSVMKDISKKVNYTVDKVNKKINESKANFNDPDSINKTLNSITDDINNETNNFGNNQSDNSGYTEYHRTKKTSNKLDDFSKNLEDTVTGALGKIGGFFEKGIDENKISDTFSEMGKNIDNFVDSIFGNNTINKSNSSEKTYQKSPAQDDDIISMEDLFDESKAEKTLKNSDIRIIRDTNTLAKVNITGVSVVGKKQLANDKNNADWFEVATVGECTIISVADGSGKKQFSNIASKESCITAVEYIKENIDSIINNPNFKEDIKKPADSINFQTGCRALAVMLQSATVKACESVQDAYDEKKLTISGGNNISIEDFKSTFILTLILPIQMDNHNREHLVLSCQVGDGTVATINENFEFNNALKILGENIPQKNYLMDAKENQYGNFMRNIKAIRRNLSKVMIMTNGVSRDYSDNSNDMLRLFLDLQLNSKLDDSIIYNKKEILYIKDLMLEKNISLENLWHNRNALTDNTLIGSNLAEKLVNWLTSYQGKDILSDDRTLIIYDALEK